MASAANLNILCPAILLLLALYFSNVQAATTHTAGLLQRRSPDPHSGMPPLQVIQGLQPIGGGGDRGGMRQPGPGPRSGRGRMYGGGPPGWQGGRGRHGSYGPPGGDHSGWKNQCQGQNGGGGGGGCRSVVQQNPNPGGQRPQTPPPTQKQQPRPGQAPAEKNPAAGAPAKQGDIGSAASLTVSEFNAALKSCGYPDATSKFKPFMQAATTKAKITSKMELAMFLAQIVHESGGLVHKEETRALEGLCNNDYKHSDDLPGRHYWGRGYIQLTWSYNYKEASQFLYNNDDLLKHPEKVAKDEQIAWDTAAWYWATKVKPKLAASPREFGLTTLAINGGLECDVKLTKGIEKAKERWQKFRKILNAFTLDPALAKESGCYPVGK